MMSPRGRSSTLGSLATAFDSTHLKASEISRSALKTLGIAVGDVGAWLLILWTCIDWFFNLDLLKEGFMKATFKTGMDVLAVLWALVG